MARLKSIHLFHTMKDYKANKLLCLFVLCFSVASQAQESSGNWLKDQKNGCKLWFKHTFSEDSVVWNGPCVEGMAEGNGLCLGFTKGEQTLRLYEKYEK